MRCLYCGKELALLKRWTGGGEFCSDAHRQQYQEEYNQLALTRLLQANPQGGGKPPESKPAEPAPEPPRETAAKGVQAPATPAPKILAEAAAPVAAQANVVEPPVEKAVAPRAAVAPAPEEEELAPAEMAGFVIEAPVPVMAEVSSIAANESGFEKSFTPSLPERRFEGWRTELVAAGRVIFEPSSRVLESASRAGERRLEVRDFVRAAPVVEFDLHAAGEGGLPEVSEEPMDILIFPHPPQGSPPLWRQGEQPFPSGIELGALARVAFRTTGVEDNQDGLELMPVETAPERTIEVAAAAPASAPKPVVQDPPPAQRTLERPPEPKVSAPEPRPAPKPAFVRPPLAEKREEKAVPVDEAPRKSDPVPDVITKALPLTLHGLAAGRGKPVQIFPSAVSNGLDIQAPRSNALPLRPVMTLGPAPAPAAAKAEERKPIVVKSDVKSDVKSEPNKPQSKPQSQPARPDTRFANSKGKKPDVRAAEPEKRDEPETKVAAAVKEPPVVAEPRKPAPVPGEAAKPKPAAPAPVIAPPSPKPYTTPDLGLPSLSMPSSDGFWNKLPVAGKAAVAVLALAIVAGGIFMISRGGSATASVGPQVVAGTPLPAPDAGWITDWGAETGVRREHDISVLRPSMSLSDYRMEFQAQIESKAIGWVYRAKDGKNFYVNKLEVVKAGLEPTVALVRFAVLNGEAQPRSQFPLSMPLRIDTLYKVRFDAVGDHFSTWVQDQKVDDFTDDRIKTGGVGLYSDRGERMSLKGSVSVVPLVIKK